MAGDEYHRTRLHDEKGNTLSLREFRYLPRNIYWAGLRRLNGTLPEVPWLTFNAISRLENLLVPSWRMIEFGSGMSTAWYARRVATLHSIEDDPEWYKRVAPTLPANVRYELRVGSAYWDLSDYDDAVIDFAVVDGTERGECMRAVIPKIRPGGWVFLDNADKDMTIPNGTVRQAESALRQAVTERGGTLEVDTGLTVGLLAVHQWLLGRL